MNQKIRYLFVFIVIMAMLKMVACPSRISGDCMEPAVKDGGLYFVNRVSCYYRQYQIGDIVVFCHEGKEWFARIVALENDTIQINDHDIIVNTVSLHDTISRNWIDWKYGVYAIENPITIPLHHIYVLSDDLSAHHDDSRVFGPIATSLITGVFW